MGGSPGDRPDRRLSRRKRRLRATGLALAVVAAAGAVALVVFQRVRATPIHRPGEEEPDITRHLAGSRPTGAPVPRFEDVTDAAGLGGFRSFEGPRSSQLPEDMGSGAAWGDVDRDGDDDLFLVAAGGSLDLPPERRAPSRLYENLGGGRFREMAGFPETRIIGMGAAFGDYDGDGWLDLAVTGYGTLLLFHNDHGRFRRVDALGQHPGFWAGVSWGDYDGDGDLDLYVCGYVRYRPGASGSEMGSQQYGAAVPFTLNPASFPPERNLLFRNDGSGRFSEVAGALGVANPEGRSLTALWHDFDDDGRPDLYVANDISDNVLFRNRGGRFEDVSHAAWVADYRGAMGLAAGDWNRDGDDDLFITHWVAQENALYDSLLHDLAKPAAGGPRGAAPRSRGSGLQFADQASMLGLGQIALKDVGWGTEFADFDGDGWLDLVVANGSTFETEEAPRRLKPQLPFLFWNRHGQFFDDLAPEVPALAEAHVARGLAVADYDGDGDLDIVIVDHDAGVQLLRNEMQTGHFLELRLRSRIGRKGRPLGYGDGALVVAHVGKVVLRRTVGSASYLSQSSRTLHFGLGKATRVDRLDLRWPDGVRESLENLPADAIYLVTEGTADARRIGPGAAAPAVAASSSPASAPAQRGDVVEFWARERAAVRAMKRDGDLERAAELFRQALELRPSHEDSLYYRAQCLAGLGRVPAAIHELATLARLNPRSHRALQQWGALLALSARNRADLEVAEKTLQRAHDLNPEETGTLLLLGEVALLRGEPDRAVERLAAACRTNPRAVGGFFLRGYVAWKRGRLDEARRLLAQAQEARGPQWKPLAAAAEGDVQRRAHRETSPLSRFWEEWDGTPRPGVAFRQLDAFLAS